MNDAGNVVVYLPGVRWDDVPGTDRRLATALARQLPVLWVDPPVPMRLWLRRSASPTTGLDVVADQLLRLRVPGPPGFTRGPMRHVGQFQVRRRLQSLITRLDIRPIATIVSSPLTTFPSAGFGKNVFFVTDDWIGGAALLGVDVRAIRGAVDRNLRRADILAAVTPQLVEVMANSHQNPLILPNGCTVRSGGARTEDHQPAPAAVLIGQLNERLDVSLVEAVADRGIPVVIVGPRTDQEPKAGAELDRLLSHPMVNWTGHRPATEIDDILRNASVGLTPYASSEFNRASFPLKTLEYLAAGLPVVSTDLPAVHWLDTAHIEIADKPEDFAARVAEILRREFTEKYRRRCDRISFAAGHTWDARAESLLARIGTA